MFSLKTLLPPIFTQWISAILCLRYKLCFFLPSSGGLVGKIRESATLSSPCHYFIGRERKQVTFTRKGYSVVQKHKDSGPVMKI